MGLFKREAFPEDYEMFDKALEDAKKEQEEKGKCT